MEINGIPAAGFRKLGFAFVAATFTMLAQPASAQFSLQGKTVTVYGSTGPGGAIGNYARPLLPFLSKYLPGKPDMVLAEMPAGGGVQAVQQTYNAARRDGTAFGAFNPGPLSMPFLTSQKVSYDLDQFNWLGSITTSATMCFVNNDSPVMSLEDARKREVSISVTGVDSGGAQVARLFNGLLGTKFKTIAGYYGTGDAQLAVERNEVDGSCVSASTLQALGSLEKNNLRYLVQATLAPKEAPFLNVPSLIDLVSTEADRQAIALLLIPYDIQFTYALPPGVSTDIVEAYRKAFDQAVVDPEYRAVATKLNQIIAPRSGRQVEDAIRKMSATPAAVRQRVVELISKD